MNANPIAAFINGILDAGIKGGETAVETYVGVQIPILEAPIVSLLTNEVIELIGNNLDETLADVVDMIVNEVQTNAQNSVLVSASKARIKAKASGDPAKIAAATAATVAAYGALGHFNGA